MKPSPKTATQVVQVSTLATTTDSETFSRSYQAKVLGITIFGVVGFVVFIKYVITKYFADLEQEYKEYSQQHQEF